MTKFYKASAALIALAIGGGVAIGHNLKTPDDPVSRIKACIQEGKVADGAVSDNPVLASRRNDYCIVRGPSRTVAMWQLMEKYTATHPHIYDEYMREMTRDNTVAGTVKSWADFRKANGL
jgi:hypothetical protein